MILAALLLPAAVVAIVFLIERSRVPAFLALMFVVVAYGIAADMTFQSIGKAFGLGFVAALEQAGLLVLAGALVGAMLPAQPLTSAAAAIAGALAGLGGSASGGLALLQPAGRAVGLALVLLSVHGLVAPSPLAVASASVLKADIGTMAWIAVPVAAVAAAAGWLLFGREDRRPGALSLGWLAIAVPLALLVAQAVAQMPSEPLGKGGAREFWTGVSRPLMLLALAIVLALLLTRRWRPELLADTRWAPLVLTVGAAGGFARVLDETGMAELLAEYMLDPRLGLLAPFLAAATVKTMQGNSLSAVLTASGMIEPMLPALGLDSATGRVLAAASVGAGSIAVCHLNDPCCWIAADMAGQSPTRALVRIGLGSLVVALAALIVLTAIRQVL
jgi:GntP family gluconate:H+ symporter